LSEERVERPRLGLDKGVMRAESRTILTFAAHPAFGTGRIPSSLPPKASRRKPAPQRKSAPQQQPVDRPAPFTRTDRGMNAIIEASADYLRRKGARADSAEIQKELVRSGILEDGPRDRSRITSYLGRAKAMFDNVRGEGYGLREWRTPSA
jgi:hypothetical protein